MILNNAKVFRIPRISVRQLDVVYLCILLAACGAGVGDDLDQFMAEAGKDAHARVKPLPQVKPYIPTQYNADKTLTDPFKGRKATSKVGIIQPNLNRTRDPLEAFSLETLKYVGTLSKTKLKYALIKAPDGSVQQVTIGSYIGQNFGVVTDINESAVMLKEIVQDDISGDWTERSSSINLQE